MLKYDEELTLSISAVDHSNDMSSVEREIWNGSGCGNTIGTFIPLSELIDRSISVTLRRSSLVRSDGLGEIDCVRGTWKAVITVTNSAIFNQIGASC